MIILKHEYKLSNKVSNGGSFRHNTVHVIIFNSTGVGVYIQHESVERM